ncbi:hypothetical protein PVAND_016030 [Polypedilum vanderplanki]|uniref:Uncharacterized protein n=1 Tax=Polypedilum vanderplanki TaxID=319348 RepID=A0A9J6BF08_POLVA|nr:hypothetical protein PVAND_016030 [Polypedilum vanderplanki]
MSTNENNKNENLFSAKRRRKLLFHYLKTNVIISFMLIFELFRGIFKIFLPNRPKCIKDKLALITGGGHGIGRELAFKMAAKGCHIVIADIDINSADATINEIKEKYKVKAAAFKVDVSNYEEVKQLRKNIESSIGYVDLLVNNVGLLALDISLREKTHERIKQVVDVNLMSHFWVIFSDESMIQLNNDRSIKTIRTKDEKFYRHCVKGAQKHPIQVMIWSCISSKGIGPIYFVTGSMNSTQYIHVLESVLQPLLPKWFRRREHFYFQQDGAPCHKAKIVTNTLNKLNLNVLDWCGNAPDFNPIENVWHTLKQEVAKKQPKNLPELKNAIVEVWNGEKVKECAKNAIASMPTRLISCIRAKVREFLDGMISRNYGHIIASGSFAGKVTLPTAITYSASKYGVTGFMSALYDELCVYGHDDIIKTTTIYPLFVNTSQELAEMAGDVPLWPAKRVASILLDGVLRNERNIFVPKFAKFSTIMNSFPDRIIKYIKVGNFNKFAKNKIEGKKAAAHIV